jgi:hypothetical protein
MLFRTIILLSLTLFSPTVFAQDPIDAMLAVVARNVITQSDIKTLALLNQYHIPDVSFLYERSGLEPLNHLVELEIIHTLASGVPIYAISLEKEAYTTTLLQKINAENSSFPFTDRLSYWLRIQIVSENYVRINLGLSKNNTASIPTYLRWLESQKTRVPHRIITED